MNTLLEFKREAVDAACSHEGIRQLLVDGGHFEVLDTPQGVVIRLAQYNGKQWFRVVRRFDIDLMENARYREDWWNHGIRTMLRELKSVGDSATITR